MSTIWFGQEILNEYSSFIFILSNYTDKHSLRFCMTDKTGPLYESYKISIALISEGEKIDFQYMILASISKF